MNGNYKFMQVSDTGDYFNIGVAANGVTTLTTVDDDATNAKQLDDGLALELDRLSDIFGTSDALEGLSALIEGRRPEYTNN